MTLAGGGVAGRRVAFAGPLSDHNTLVRLANGLPWDIPGRGRFPFPEARP